ncbi:hypothetical protein [Sphingomonas crusticola]|uniref:hypothetical protein n=1 Tax=Sphingomonas crusticola TaxID=1697973 RepID=UPI000E2769C7|nr:hypothetical protein [Sphingomonas crusticola]
MALFAIWHETAAPGAAERLHCALLAEAPIVPERVTRVAIDTAQGRWQLSVFACANHFYGADAQLWSDPGGGTCIIHGLIWRIGSDKAALLDAQAVAALLARPGQTLPADIAGEYAILRLHPCGTAEAFGDPAGLHQIFHHSEGAPILSNRAAFVATVAGDRRPDSRAGLWLGAIGYRVGAASAWAAARQLPQGGRMTALATGSVSHVTALQLPAARGYVHGGEELLAAGLEQAKAAVRLAANGATLDLPITGGKDSRVVLAIALAAGLRDRLTLFTRGYAGHPDVVVGAQLAREIGIPHRREAPLGSDLPADLPPRAFLRLLAIIAWQTDGAMGGWDNVSGRTIGKATLVSGHLGEVLKGYAKRVPEGPRDGVEMVRLQAPFDPMELLRGPARAHLAEQLEEQMAAARAAGADEPDLPDLFYWQNRVPNWLGGIRSIKSFERQPILPLGVPALMRLAFQMTAAERKAELAHFKLIEAAAPELLDLPFAHQSWDRALGIASAPPVLAAPGSAFFGSWQWSINRVPEVRAALAGLFAEVEIPLWADVDRARFIDALRQRRFDYFDAISLLGFATAAIHQAGLGIALKLDGKEPAEARIDRFADATPARVTGHLDAVRGAATRNEDALILDGSGDIWFDGWLHAPDWPGATPVIEARVDGRIVASAAADMYRADLAQARIGDGHHGFSLMVDGEALRGADEVILAVPGREDGPAGGRLAVKSAAAKQGG